MKHIFAALVAFLPLMSNSQGTTTGTYFQTGLSWKEVKAKAEAEHKYIFMDCYATWCGPCKWMNKNIDIHKIL